MAATTNLDAGLAVARQQPEAKPVGGLMDRRFNYVPAVATDIRKTFRRLKAAERRAAQAQAVQP